MFVRELDLPICFFFCSVKIGTNGETIFREDGKKKGVLIRVFDL